MIDTLAELKVFLRGHNCNRQKIVDGLKTMLVVFEPQKQEDNLVPFQSVYAAAKRVCDRCKSTGISQKRWDIGRRICYDCAQILKSGGEKECIK